MRPQATQGQCLPRQQLHSGTLLYFFIEEGVLEDLRISLTLYLTGSEQFGWANMRFDDIFSLPTDTCAYTHLQPFFGVFGTFISSLTGRFACSHRA